MSRSESPVHFRLAKYAIALGLVGAACLLRWSLPGPLERTPYLVFFPAVAAAALLGGFLPGLLAAILATLSVDLFFDNTPWRLDLDDPSKLTRGALFLIGGLIISLLAHQMRSALRARSRLASIVDSSEDAILSEDVDGTIRTWNPAAQRLFGYRPEEIIGRSITVLLPPETSKEEEAITRALREGRSLSHLETVRLAKDGLRIEVAVTLSPLRDEQGRVVGTSKILRDIRQRKEAQAQLQASEQRLRRFYDSGIVGVIYWNMQGAITDANDKFLQMVGYSREDLAAGRIDWARMTPPEYHARDEQSIAELKATGVNAVPFEKEYLRKDGSRLWVLVTGAMLDERRHDGVAFVLDIAQRKAAEEAVRLQAGALEATANAISLSTTDGQGTIIWVNRAFTRLTGYGAAEVLGQNHRILNSGRQDEAFYRAMWETISRGEVWHGELVNQRKDGTLYDEEMTITPLRDQQGRVSHFIALKQDVTQRKADERALRAARISAEKAKAVAEEASKAKDHFLAVLSHELRTPLTAVLPAIEVLAPLQGEDGKELLEMVRRNVEMEARLIDDRSANPSCPPNRPGSCLQPEFSAPQTASRTRWIGRMLVWDSDFIAAIRG